MAPPEPWNNTPTRPIRVPLDLWERFGEAAKQNKLDRSTVLRDFMRWYVHEVGAKMPKRPTATEAPEPGRRADEGMA